MSSKQTRDAARLQESDATLRTIASRIERCADMDEVVALLSRELPARLPVSDRVSMVFVEPDRESMRVYRIAPPAPTRGAPLPKVRMEGTPVGRVVREGSPSVVADTRADPNITFGHASKDQIRSTLSAPIVVGGRVVGAINTGSKTPDACTSEMLGPLIDLAEVIGPAVFAAERHLSGPLDRDVVGFDSPERTGPLIGESRCFRNILVHAQRAARGGAEVLITGETGVGKTALARQIHQWSPRANGPFVTVQLADLATPLVESELFGHAKGAFTGADHQRIGRIESANGGTLFLDEIGEADLAVQAKLLRVIQDKRFERVGSNRPISANIHVVAATSVDLRSAVAAGSFRKDLLYRLEIVPLHVPPLRDRLEDLPALVASILSRHSERPRRLSERAWSRLYAHSWPGNIRELEAVLRRASILEDGDELDLDSIGSADSDHRTPWLTLEEHQRMYILRVLEHTGGVIEGSSGAAKILGLRPSTLRSRMKKLGISATEMRAKGAR